MNWKDAEGGMVQFHVLSWHMSWETGKPHIQTLSGQQGTDFPQQHAYRIQEKSN
jgi:hypothetical protein